MKKTNLFTLVLFLILFSNCQNQNKPEPADNVNVKNIPLPPAIPLITIDPYTSIWSFGSDINQSCTKHWTGKNQSMMAILRVDGTPYRILGADELKLNPVAGASTENYSAFYTTKKPGENWTQTDFNPTNWKQGPAAFGNDNSKKQGTNVSFEDIWIRRTVNIESVPHTQLYARVNHDDGFEMYINGIKAVEDPSFKQGYIDYVLTDEASASLKQGENIIAVHCNNSAGPGFIDFGLACMEVTNQTEFGDAKLISAKVGATQTIYTYACGDVEVELNFTTPLILTKPEIMSRPVSYFSYKISSSDNKEHEVGLYFDAASQLAVDNNNQEVELEKYQDKGLDILKCGSTEQNILGKKGDNVRIDWGYLYLVSSVKDGQQGTLSSAHKSRNEFAETGKVKTTLPEKTGLKVYTDNPVLAFSSELGKVSDQPLTGFIMVAYDDIKSVEYFGKPLEAYWKKDGKTIEQVLELASNEFPELMKECSELDNKLIQDASLAGGEEYAHLCSWVYRQAIAAHKYVSGPDGIPLLFSKENFSNGSIGTVDVTYPSIPIFLYYNPELVKSLLEFIFYFSESGKWEKPFAAHDVGTYPIANGQTYSADMPVEECGNMIISTAATVIAQNDIKFAERHWDILTKWANYLEKNGFDPGNQLCTDDFAGHLARNANLSIKSIMALASYGRMAKMMGKEDVATKYNSMAKEMAGKWQELAADSARYNLTFSGKGTWSQKYNLVWDKVLDLNIFPPEVAQTEIEWYLQIQNEYGLPLDSRASYTKNDWIMWSATMAESKEDFEKLVHPVYLFATQSPDKIPFSDWYDTKTSKVVGFRARSVVGGFFMKMVDEKLNTRETN